MLDGLGFEPGRARRRRRRRREAGGHLGTFGALAHDVAACPAARDERQGIDHDGFSGAGFAGERGEAGGKFELGAVDQHEIAQLQVREHGSSQRPLPS